MTRVANYMQDGTHYIHVGGMLTALDDELATTATITFNKLQLTSPTNIANVTIPYTYRYGFNGQERQDELYGSGNAYDFGARMYDSRIGRRWNVDPVDQISVSNYACMLNNAILNNDPFGLSTWIQSKEDKDVKYKYKNGKVFDVKGNELNKADIKDEFVLQTIAAIDDAAIGDCHNILSKIENDEENDVTIVYGKETFYDKNILSFNPLSAMEVTKENEETGKKEKGVQSPSLGLLHEFAHAYIEFYSKGLEKAFSKEELDFLYGDLTRIEKTYQYVPTNNEDYTKEHRFILRVIEDQAVIYMIGNSSRTNYYFGNSLFTTDSPISTKSKGQIKTETGKKKK